MTNWKDPESIKAHHARYRAENHDLILARNKKYRTKNRELIRARSREYREKNRELLRVKSREYANKNREWIRAKNKERYWKYPERRSKPCTKEYFQAYREANVERIRAEARSRYATNPKKYNKYSKAYYTANREKVGAMTRAWRLANPYKVYAIAQRRLERLYNLSGTHTKEEIIGLIDAANGICPACGDPPTEYNPWCIDHITPISWKGSTNYIINLQPLCRKCNTSKGNHHDTNYIIGTYIEEVQQKLMRVRLAQQKLMKSKHDGNEIVRYGSELKEYGS